MHARKGSLKARQTYRTDLLKENEKVLSKARALADKLASIRQADWHKGTRKEILEEVRELPYQGQKEFHRVHQALSLEINGALVWTPQEPGIRDEWSGPIPKWDSPEFPGYPSENSLVKDQSYPIYRGQWMAFKFVGFDLITLGGETVAIQGFGPKGTPYTVTHQGRLTYCRVR